jgi:hypothetical protein
MFNNHAFSETWIKTSLFFSAGFMFARLDNTRRRPVTGNLE